ALLLRRRPAESPPRHVALRRLDAHGVRHARDHAPDHRRVVVNHRRPDAAKSERLEGPHAPRLGPDPAPREGDLELPARQGLAPPLPAYPSAGDPGDPG